MTISYCHLRLPWARSDKLPPISGSELEALACGCAVLIVAPGNGGELVDEGNFADLRDADFCVNVESPAISAENVKRAFGRYSAELSTRLAAQVRSICRFSAFAGRIDEIFSATIAMHVGYVEDLEAEQRATSVYLQNLASLIKQMDLAQKKPILHSTRAMFRDVSAKLAAIQAALDKPYD
jgi:hypothetical protein